MPAIAYVDQPNHFTPLPAVPVTYNQSASTAPLTDTKLTLQERIWARGLTTRQYEALKLVRRWLICDADNVYDRAMAVAQGHRSDFLVTTPDDRPVQIAIAIQNALEAFRPWEPKPDPTVVPENDEHWRHGNKYRAGINNDGECLHPRCQEELLALMVTSPEPPKHQSPYQPIDTSSNELRTIYSEMSSAGQELLSSDLEAQYREEDEEPMYNGTPYTTVPLQKRWAAERDESFTKAGPLTRARLTNHQGEDNIIVIPPKDITLTPDQRSRMKDHLIAGLTRAFGEMPTVADLKANRGYLENIRANAAEAIYTGRIRRTINEFAERGIDRFFDHEAHEPYTEVAVPEAKLLKVAKRRFGHDTTDHVAPEELREVIDEYIDRCRDLGIQLNRRRILRGAAPNMTDAQWSTYRDMMCLNPRAFVAGLADVLE